MLRNFLSQDGAIRRAAEEQIENLQKTNPEAVLLAFTQVRKLFSKNIEPSTFPHTFAYPHPSILGNSYIGRQQHSTDSSSAFKETMVQ